MATKAPKKPAPKARNRNREVDPSELWPNSLAEIRKSRGRHMTQARLAEMISRPGDPKPVGQTTIAAIETGRISGRRYMYRIAEALDVDARDIFPYAGFVSVAEAARTVGVKPEDIRHSGVTLYPIKGTQFVKVEDVMSAGLKARRTGPSLREQIQYLLTQNPGMTAAELTDELGPYETTKDETKRKNTIMVLLSRYPWFMKDESTFPASWRYSKRKHTMAQNGTLPEQKAAAKKKTGTRKK